MDPSRFDRLVRSLARSASRRATLATLLGGAVAGALERTAAAAPQGRRTPQARACQRHEDASASGDVAGRARPLSVREEALSRPLHPQAPVVPQAGQGLPRQRPAVQEEQPVLHEPLRQPRLRAQDRLRAGRQRLPPEQRLLRRQLLRPGLRRQGRPRAGTRPAPRRRPAVAPWPAVASRRPISAMRAACAAPRTATVGNAVRTAAATAGRAGRCPSGQTCNARTGSARASRPARPRLVRTAAATRTGPVSRARRTKPAAQAARPASNCPPAETCNAQNGQCTSAPCSPQTCPTAAATRTAAANWAPPSKPVARAGRRASTVPARAPPARTASASAPRSARASNAATMAAAAVVAPARPAKPAMPGAVSASRVRPMGRPARRTATVAAATASTASVPLR